MALWSLASALAPRDPSANHGYEWRFSNADGAAKAVNASYTLYMLLLIHGVKYSFETFSEASLYEDTVFIPLDLLALADEQSTSTIFARSARGKSDLLLALTTIGTPGTITGIRVSRAVVSRKRVSKPRSRACVALAAPVS